MANDEKNTFYVQKGDIVSNSILGHNPKNLHFKTTGTSFNPLNNHKISHFTTKEHQKKNIGIGMGLPKWIKK